MSTGAEIRAKVGLRTGRSGETNFASIVNNAVDEFLLHAAKLHDFKVMTAVATTLAFAAGEYRAALPTVTLTGFSTTVHHIISAFVRLHDDSQSSYPLKVRPFAWFDAKYPDRSRSGSLTSKPAFAARVGTYLELQAPTSAAYDVYLTTSQLPSSFASGSSENPIPLLDEALAAYGVYAVFDAVEAYDAADRNLNKAVAILQAAIATDGKEPIVLNIAEPPSVRMRDGYRFNLSQLQELYPEGG